MNKTKEKEGSKSVCPFLNKIGERLFVFGIRAGQKPGKDQKTK